MATNGQLDGSACAVYYLNQEEVAPEAAPRPQVQVPVDISYSLDRYLNSHLHPEDRHLRPSQSPTPLTEAESRARMAAILSSMVLDTPSKPK
ncbi:hypothetical protein GGR53DRAFT_160071 [Hypoxylon sp. FL1150]|nr:hypothetical protein GGR53DRAFT_160071 [Hypoxylon sp. FL1150]